MNLKHIAYIAGTALALSIATACSPDEVEMPEKNVAAGDLVQGLAYSVTPDAANPNIIHLKSLLPTSYTVVWEHPQGRSQERSIDLEIPFEGEYTVKFGVETRGGLVFGEPYEFTIASFCADFVSDKSWMMLTGGVGKSKTWIYDDGSYGIMGGELSYGDPAANPNLGYNNFTENWTPGKGHCEEDAMYGSSMTFDLIGGANYSYTNANTGETQVGKYTLNTGSYTMSFSDADLMHPDKWTPRRPDWRRDFKVIELTENNLRIGYVRQAGNWGGEWVEVFNYVSKEYADTYTPPVIDKEPEPELPEGWQDLFNNQNIYAAWQLDTDVPFDWCNLDGTRRNGFTKPGDYPAGYTPVELDDVLKLKFTSPATDDYKVTLPDGSTVEGKFSVNASGFITFSNGVGTTALGGQVSFTTMADNTLRILSYETDDLGRMSSIWLGYKEVDVQGKGIDYIGFHFVANYGGAKEEPTYKATLNWNDTSSWTMVTSDVVYVKEGTYTVSLPVTWTAGDPLLWLDVAKILKDHPNADVVITDIKVDGTSIAFNDADISRGDSDGDTNTARRYICNAWGLAPCFSSLDIFKATTGFEVTFKIVYENGTPFIPAK